MNFVLVLLVIWVAVAGGWWILTNAFKSADADKIKNRLLGANRLSRGKKGDKDAIPLIAQEDKVTGRIVLRVLHRYQLQDRLKTLLDQAGLKWKVARLIHTCLALFLAGFAAGWLFLPARFQTLAVLPALAAGCLPLLYVTRVRSRRLAKFEEQFPESLEFVARSMRAGHAFSVSLEMLHREFQEPLAGEFRRTFEEHNLGLPLDAALQKLAVRVPSLDVHFFVSAVLLQKRTGGNLAEILDKLAYVIRERFKLRGKIRAISAHGRMTGMSLSAIPCAVAAMMFITNPEYVTFFLKEETGNMMALGAIGLQVLGYLIIKKIVSIEV
ncbi:type II secretion system F family protein [uncultured Paludibaculum sp.]|uniref:type II secretion system F family protein n=1 Tax=uncultured Paludibaculum sp. TaxID=1765020 RepID=UPI002AAC1E14|nr:type II secretion system F family protein [uncultured Paludibaculum sp.]